jgi:hypothetical protein
VAGALSDEDASALTSEEDEAAVSTSADPSRGIVDLSRIS